MAGTRLLSAPYLRDLGTRLFLACGAPADEAAIVADELIEASLMGLDSHGVIRIRQYLDEVSRGKIRPGAPLRIVKETPATAVVDCGFNFGPVTAARMAEIVCRKARTTHVACVVSQNSHHVSRLGAYVQAIAEQGMFGFAVANSSKHGHWVAPWGGSEGRLATNPLAYAAPGTAKPILLDMSTSMIAEGKIRVLQAQGQLLPPGCIRKANGEPSTDPRDFYGPPRGTIQPFGSELGFRGFGLGLMVEILGGILAGQASSEDLPYINGVCLVGIDPEAFCGATRFRQLIDDLCCYVTSCPPAPGFEEVILPGAREFCTKQERLATGIPVAEKTWQEIGEMAQRWGVELGEPERLV